MELKASWALCSRRGPGESGEVPGVETRAQIVFVCSVATCPHAAVGSERPGVPGGGRWSAGPG